MAKSDKRFQLLKFFGTAQITPIYKGDATQCLPTRLNHHPDDDIHVVYDTVASQYFPLSVQNACSKVLETVGKKASITKPLVTLSMEVDSRNPRALITMRFWPLGETNHLERVDFHGRWIQ